MTFKGNFSKILSFVLGDIMHTPPQAGRPSLLARACARVIDYCLVFGFGLLLSLVLPFDVNPLFYLLFGMAVPPLFVPLEALFLSLWKTTPGKAFFGISLSEKPSYKEAFQRAFFLKNRPGVLKQIPPPLFRILLGYTVTLALLTFTILSKQLTEYTIGFEQQQKITGWVQYSSKEAGFHVHFPTDPQQEAKEVALPHSSGSVNYNEFKSQTEPHVTYSVSYIDLPKKWSFVSSKRILRGVFDVLYKLESANELFSKEFTVHKSHSAMDFHYKKGDEEIVGRLIRVGQRLFKVTIAYPASLKDRPIAHEFLESFIPEGKG